MSMSSFPQDTDFVRRAIVHMAAAPCGAHLGGSLSCSDILVTLYREVMRVRPQEPLWSGRDFFILSKGHAAPALYATLALAGFIDAEELATYGRPGSRLGGHPKRSLPGVEFATGSLGHGLSIAVGLALALRIRGMRNRVYVLLGDGELQEGAIWEAAQTAGKYRLSSIVAIVDCNHLQINGPTDDWLPRAAMPKRWKSFGWAVETIDGHAHPQILGALTRPADRPKVILADTIKAKGIDFMENNRKSHHVTLSGALLDRALHALSGAGSAFSAERRARR